MRKKIVKLVCCLALIICCSISMKAQLPIKNSALVGEWKLISLSDENGMYSYNCEEKEFYGNPAFLAELGEAVETRFKNKIINEAETSLLKVKANGDYELAFGMSKEKGTWKSKAVDEDLEGFEPNKYGNLVLTTNSEPSANLILIEKQQLFIKIYAESEDGEAREFLFRNDFKGNVFK